MARGKVYLVGAGPGGPDLLTIRGRQVLRLADVVVYDGLVGRGVLRLIPRRTRRLRVAKGPRERDPFPQSRIDRLLVEEANSGKQVVRLKGGDAWIFSRGGEEAEMLREHRVPFEVVPGVSSALAAPTYAGIPVTDRRYSSSVAIVTGHESAEKPGRSVHWGRLARSVDTLVVLMGVASWESIATELRDAGLSPDTPVATIRWATTGQQRTELFTLGEARRASLRARLRSPSVVVVGRTVALAPQLRWYRGERRSASRRFLRVAARLRLERANARRAGPIPEPRKRGRTKHRPRVLPRPRPS
jgi:uroporphyrinogen III methyltransferase/synthase